jgi:hypothetical protein
VKQQNMRKAASVAASVLTVGVLVGGPLPQARAQTGPFGVPPGTPLLPTRNTREIGFGASFLLNDDRPFAVSGTYGVFTSPRLQVGVTGGISGSKDSNTFSSLGAFGNYYFRGDDASEPSFPLLPYVGIFAGYAHRERSGASLGAQTGVKYFLNPSVALTGELQYRSTRHGGGNTQLLFGIATFLR